MSPVSFVALCVQACLIQTVLSQQCYGPNMNFPYNAGAGSAGACAPAAPCAQYGGVGACAPAAPCAQYGGVGAGQVGVTGDVGASGSTAVVGSVPVLGAVDFSGVVPACGSVSISGQCGCGCNA